MKPNRHNWSCGVHEKLCDVQEMQMKLNRDRIVRLRMRLQKEKAMKGNT